jgi:hypothetical protein
MMWKGRLRGLLRLWIVFRRSHGWNLGRNRLGVAVRVDVVAKGTHRRSA